MYVVYIVSCADGSLYTGIARNLAKRLQAHKDGTGSKYVRARLPVTLVYTESQPNRSLATKRELQIKKLSKKEKDILISAQESID